MDSSRIVRRLRRELSRLRPAAIRDRLNLLVTDARYDIAHGAGTGGTWRLSRLTIDSPNRKYGIDYRAVYPGEFEVGMKALPIKDFGSYTFIDLGAGKGRALLMAQRYKFRRYIGVEFAKELHEYAAVNLQNYANIELNCMDAAEYRFPREPLVVFLYNPFGPEVMEKVADNLRGHNAFVVYVNPFFVKPWADAGFSGIKIGNAFVLSGPVAADVAEGSGGA
jgi:hypothetical protein